MSMRTYPLRATLGLLACLGISGCGAPAPAATSDPGKARTTLRDALDSWKKGDPSDALSKGSPIVYVADEDWQGGAKLEDFAIDANDQMLGTSLRCPVSLKIKDLKGKSMTRKAIYLVTTAPVLRVDRQDTQ